MSKVESLKVENKITANSQIKKNMSKVLKSKVEKKD